MILTQIKDVINVSSDAATGYKYLYSLYKATTAGYELVEYAIAEVDYDFKITVDGLYKVVCDKLPVSPPVSPDDNYYYIDANAVYRGSTIPQKILFGVFVLISKPGTNVLEVEDQIFSTYFTKKLYVAVLKQSLVGSMQCGPKPNLLRDALMMGLDVIGYLIDYKQLDEANRIMERLYALPIVNTCNCNG